MRKELKQRRQSPALFCFGELPRHLHPLQHLLLLQPPPLRAAQGVKKAVYTPPACGLMNA